MKQWIAGIVTAGFALSAALGADLPLKVAATTGMVAGIVREVGGDRVVVDQLMGPGVDPHLYKPSSQDARRLSEATVIFYSGLMLEGRMGDLFAQLGRGGKKVYAATEGIAESRLLEPPEFAGHYDPHLWFDVSLWMETVPVIVTALSETDPEGKADYEKRGGALKGRLVALDAWCHEFAETLPAEKRILVTSHDAYNYFGRAYGFKVVALQGVSTVSEASLSDVTGLVDFVRKQGVKAIFVESSVNPAAIKRVAADAGVKIGGEIFSDAMGSPGQMKNGFDTGTYEGMVKSNLTTIVEALK